MKHNPDSCIVAIDVDGTLGDYHGHFLRFAADWYGREMPDPKQINPGLPLHKFMRTSKQTYRQCKLAYRQGGLERSMPIYDGAYELCRSVRAAGAELWLCSTRPYLKLDSQSVNTRHWLRRHKIQYDALIFGERKYMDLARIVGSDRTRPGRSRVAAVLDDLPEMILQADGLGMWTMLRDQPYNRHLNWHYRAMDLHQAKNTILQEVKTWKKPK